MSISYGGVPHILLSVALGDADWLWIFKRQSLGQSLQVVIRRAKRSTPTEKALKTELKTGVRLFVAFCLTDFSV